MATPTKELQLTGTQTFDMGFKPSVPNDALVQLKPLSVESIELMQSYRIKSSQDYAQVAQLVLVSAERMAVIDADYEDITKLAHAVHRHFTGDREKYKAGWNSILTLGKRELARWDSEQARLKAAEEARIRREEEAKQRAAYEEARKLQAAADAKAAELRRQGDVRAAKEAQQQAVSQAQELIAAAEPIGVILPDSRTKVSGISPSSKWKARLTGETEADQDAALMDLIRAIAAGRVSLRHLTPVRGSAPQKKRLVDVDETVLSEIGNRLRKQDLGIPGTEGYTEHSTRVSPKAMAAAYVPPSEPEGMQW